MLRHSPPSTPAPRAQLQHYDSDPNICTSHESKIDVSARFKRKREDDFSTLKLDLQRMFETWQIDQNNKHTSLLTSMQEIKEQNEDIRTSIEFISHKYEEMRSKLETLETERETDRKYILTLENKLEIIERRTRQSNLEIRNVSKIPKNPDSRETKKDLVSVIQNMGNSLNVPLKDTDIRDVFRTNSKTEACKPIVVELCSVLLRDKIIKAVKDYNKTHKNSKFNSTNLMIEGAPKPVYVDEYLTFLTKRLYSITRQFAKTNGYDFCWVSHGVVYLRKTQGTPLFRIEGEGDLDKLKPK